jgi:AcrR family transcriptional regulator
MGRTPAPKAARERQHRRFEERDRRIRETAQRLLLERGLHGFSMDDVAEAIDYSKGTVYQHYESKEDALVASCADSCARLATSFERAADYEGRPRERMLAVIEAYCAFVRDRATPFRVIPLVHSPTVLEKADPARLKAMEATQARSVAAWCGIIRDGIARGDLTLPKGHRPETVSFSLWSLMFGSFMLAELYRPEGLLGVKDPTEAIRASCTALLDGLGWRPTSKEVDYAEVSRRIRKGLSGEGGRRAR